MKHRRFGVFATLLLAPLVLGACIGQITLEPTSPGQPISVRFDNRGVCEKSIKNLPPGHCWVTTTVSTGSLKEPWGVLFTFTTNNGAQKKVVHREIPKKFDQHEWQATTMIPQHACGSTVLATEPTVEVEWIDGQREFFALEHVNLPAC